MRKIWGFIVFLCVFGVGFASAAEPIKFGYIATLTGDGATWGQHERDGALMAVKEINAKGGLLGRPVELVCYDIKGKPEDAITAVRRMIYEDNVIAIGGCNYSGVQLAVAPIADKGQVPMIASAATNPAVTVDPSTGKVRPYMFRIAYTDPYQGSVMADYLIQKKGAKKIAIFGDVGDAYSEGLTEYIRKRADELKIENKFWGYRAGDVDFRALLTDAKAWGADAVAMPMIYKEMGLVVKQASDLGWKPLFIGGDGYSPAIFEIAGTAMEGTLWVYPMADPANKDFQELMQKYKQEYGKDASEVMNVVLGYDIMQMLFDATLRAGKAEGPALRDAIADTKDLKVVHFSWTVDKETHNPLNKPAAILMGKDGKLEFLEIWQPQLKF